ncbi:MAG: hypothetical protein AAFU53_04145 [Cyanobacteria bacterium J06632_3]
MNSDNTAKALAVVASGSIVTQVGPGGVALAAVGGPALLAAAGVTALFCWGAKKYLDEQN